MPLPSDLCTAHLPFQLLCLDRVTKTMSVALLLMNNLDNSRNRGPSCSAQLHLPTHDLFRANLRVQLHLPPVRSHDLLISPGTFGISELSFPRGQKGRYNYRREGWYPDHGSPKGGGGGVGGLVVLFSRAALPVAPAPENKSDGL